MRQTVHVDHIQFFQAQRLVEELFVVRRHVVVVFKRLQVVIEILFQRIHIFHVENVVVDESNDSFQLADVKLVVVDVVPELLDLVLVGLLPLSTGQLFDFKVLLFDTLLQFLNVLCQPLGRSQFRFLGWIQFFFASETFLRVCFGFGLLFANLELLHFGFDEFSRVDQSILVFDIGATDPSFDLIAQPLQLFDLFFQINLVLLLQVLRIGVFHCV